MLQHVCQNNFILYFSSFCWAIVFSYLCIVFFFSHFSFCIWNSNLFLLWRALYVRWSLYRVLGCSVTVGEAEVSVSAQRTHTRRKDRSQNASKIYTSKIVCFFVFFIFLCLNIHSLLTNCKINFIYRNGSENVCVRMRWCYICRGVGGKRDERMKHRDGVGVSNSRHTNKIRK